MSSLTVNSSVNIESKEIPITASPNWLKLIANYLGKGKGHYKLFKFVTVSMTWMRGAAGKMGWAARHVTVIKEIRGASSNAAKFMCVSKAHGTFTRFVKAVKKYTYAKDVSVATEAKAAVTKEAFTLMTDLSYVLQLVQIVGIEFGKRIITHISLVGNGSRVITDVMDGLKAKNDFFKCCKEENVAKKINNKIGIVDAKEGKRLALILLIKAVSSFALCMFSIIAIVTGTLLVSSTAMFSLVTISLVSSIWAEFYKSSMSRNLREIPTNLDEKL